jgi:hypothetical protein
LKRIDKKQIKLIHIAKAQLGLSDEEYRAILSDRYWVNTCTKLSYHEAHDLIEYFKSLGFKIRKSKKKKKTPPNVIQLVSRQQLALIEHLKEDIYWRIPDGYNRWLKKFLKKERIATSKEANAVIEALKAMRKRQEKINVLQG